MKRGKQNRDNSVGRIDSVILPAIVIGVMNKQAKMRWEESEIVCSLPGNLVPDRNSLVVGDQVDIEPTGNEQYRLLRVKPRNSALYRGNRKAPGEQILVAANIDTLFVVVTAKYLLHQAGYLEEAIVAAHRAGIEIGLFVSKTDLIGEAAEASIKKKLTLYAHALKFMEMGSTLESGDRMNELVKGKRIAIVGDRANGKTTLLHSLLTEHSKMRIASTHASSLVAGPNNTHFIDTPGFREFALTDITIEERAEVFPEIENLVGGCGFSDCSHTHEEDCRVRDALRSGEILRERYDAYRGMSNNAGVMNQAPVAQSTQVDYRNTACNESFTCKSCGAPVGPEGAGSRHRNHCPNCLSSLHVDEKPGDRASLCGGVMEPVSVWVRKGGEWALIQRCRLCGTFSSNRVAADDNPALLMSLAVRPLASTPFPLERIDEMLAQHA